MAENLPRKWDGNLISWAGLLFAGSSFYFIALVFAYALEIRKLPADRFEGGPGFALSGPVMLYGAVGIFCGLVAAFLLLIALLQYGRKSARAPNFILGILLVPASYVALTLCWRIIAQTMI